MLPMPKEVEGVAKKKPDKAVMDAGYYSKENLEKAEKLQAEWLCDPQEVGGKNSREKKGGEICL